MSVQEFAKLAVRAAIVGGAGLAIVAPSADARLDPPGRAAAPARQHVASLSVPRHAPTGVPAPQLRRLIREDAGGLDGAIAGNQTPARHNSPAPQLRRLIREDPGGLDGAVAAIQPPAGHTSPATPRAASGGVDWVTAAIGGVAFAGVLGLIWLSAAAIGRVTRPRVTH